MNRIIDFGRCAALASLTLIAVDALAASAAPTTQIYQQRGADGRIVLTDRPSPTAVTERAWQIDAEDAAAARQRAQDVKTEAQAVSERVQRGIDSRAADAQREQLARADRAERAQRADLAEQERLRAIDLSNDRGVEIGTYFTPYLLRPPYRPHRPHRPHHPRSDRDDDRPRPTAPRVKGSATPENR